MSASRLLIMCICTFVGTFADLLVLAPERPTLRAFEGDVALSAVTATAAAIAVGVALA